MTEPTQRLDGGATTRLPDTGDATLRLDSTQEGTLRLPENDGGTLRLPDNDGGTLRLPDNDGGTLRLPVGDGGTQRIPFDDEATLPLTVGNNTGFRFGGMTDTGTQLLASNGTQLLGDGAGSRPAAAPPTSSGGEYFAAGQTIVLDGVSYRVQCELNTTSGEAVTYVVERGGQSYVLKHYRPGVHAQAALLEKISKAPHEDIIRIHAFGRHNGQDYEVMDYALGGHLARFVRERGCLRDLPLLRKITGEIANGLHFMHNTLGLIYQDLKPENILFLDAACTDVVLADFGISSLIEPGKREVIVKAHGTKEYAAPELTRFGNQTDTVVDAGVDYFALGITLLECWTGQRPFQGLPDALRLAQIRNKEVVFPADMDPQLATLIKGLINPLPRERWGHAEVMRWVAGESLQVEYVATLRPYEQRSFNDQETFCTPAQLAQLLERYPEKGQDYLYLGRIREWLDRANDMDLSTEIEKIERQFNKDDAHKAAGLLRAIHALDPGRPFVSHGGRSCTTGGMAGDAFEAEADHYRKALLNPLEPFYLYLQATGAGEVASELLALFNSGLDPALAFNMALYELQGEGEDRLKFNGHYHYLPDDFAQADTSVRAALLAELRQGHSRALIWLNKLGFIRQTKAAHELDAADRFTLLKLFPWLGHADLVDSTSERQAGDAIALIVADRRDLLDVYAQRKLSLNVRDNRGYAPLHVAASRNQADIVAWLLDQGADINSPSSDGNTALMWTSIFRAEQAQQALLARKPNLSHANGKGATALSLACTVQIMAGTRYPLSTAIIEGLLASGADAGLADAAGQIPLHQALHHAENPAQALAVTEAFIKSKADLQKEGNDVGKYGLARYPALIAAMLAYEFVAKRNDASLKVVERLLDAGCKPAALCEGKAALHHAAGWGSEKLCQLLLAKGASKVQGSADKDLPVNFARMGKHKAVADILEPGFMFRVGNSMLRGADMLARAFVLLTLFFSLGYLAGGLADIGLQGAGSWITGFVLAHVFLAYALLSKTGSFPLFRSRLAGTLRYPRGAIAYVIFLPLVLGPVIWAIATVMTKLLEFLPALRILQALPAKAAAIGGSHPTVSALLVAAMLALLLIGQLQISPRSIAIHETLRRYKWHR